MSLIGIETSTVYLPDAMVNAAKNELLRQGDALCHVLGALMQTVGAGQPTPADRRAALAFSTVVLVAFERMARELEVPDLEVMLADVRAHLFSPSQVIG